MASSPRTTANSASRSAGKSSSSAASNFDEPSTASSTILHRPDRTSGPERELDDDPAVDSENRR
jgi:hypothetical protein